MEDDGLGKYTISFGLSLAITSVLSAILDVLKELDPPLLNLMKQLTGHHWITHGLFDIIVFVVVGFGLAQLHSGEGFKVPAKSFVTMIVGAILVGGLIINGFYLIVG